MNDKDEPRYFVNSEQCRGEPRVYWIVDRQAASGFSSGLQNNAGRLYTSRQTAERACKRLNEKAGQP